MRAAKDQASMHIRRVSSETSLIAPERRDIDEGSGQIYYTRFIYFSHIRTANDQAGLHIRTVSPWYSALFTVTK